MFFNSIKEINRLRKEINRLLSKGMSNIYLKVTFEKNLPSQNFDFLNLKNVSPGQFFGELQLTQVSLIFKSSCCNLKIRGLGTKLCLWLFCYFNCERTYDVLKSKSPSILLNNNINFNKNEMESKMENPTHSFRETNLVLQLI